MAENMTRLTQYKKLVPKCSEFNKENDCSIGSCSTNNKVEKKKGLFVNMETQATSTVQSLQTSIIDKSHFQVYCDNEHRRSRSHVPRFDKKRTRSNTESAAKPILQGQKENSNLHITLRRTHSSANFQTSRNYSQRSRSENRQSSSISHERKTVTSRLSEDVVQRTIMSIQEWKTRMSKSQSTIPKCSMQKKISKSSIKVSTPKTTDSPKPKSKHLLNKNSKEIIEASIPKTTNSPEPKNKNLLNEVISTDQIDEMCYENRKQINKTHVSVHGNEVKDLIITLKSTNHFINEWHLEYVPETEREREEKAPKLGPRFLQENINADQRKIIVEYLIRLGIRCSYPSNIIYQAVKLFNVAIDRVLVELENIQLLALTALWIVLKRELIFDKIPSATTVLKYAKDMYTKQEKNLLEYERKLLLTVKFNTRFADPYTLLLYYVNRVNSDSMYKIPVDSINCIYFCGSYLLDVSMLDEALSNISECILAMAAAELALHFVHPNNSQASEAWCGFWRRKYFMEWEERTIYFVKRRMIQHTVNNDQTTTSSYIIYKKYLRSAHCKISKFLLKKAKSISSQPEFS